MRKGEHGKVHENERRRTEPADSQKKIGKKAVAEAGEQMRLAHLKGKPTLPKKETEEEESLGAWGRPGSQEKKSISPRSPPKKRPSSEADKKKGASQEEG